MTATKLPAADWTRDPRLARLVAALTAEGGAVRYVGGAVRDTIAGLPVSDVDLATPLEPVEVVARLKAADIKAVPTGIAHGTVTAIVAGKPFEVTTLRRDVATDGRRATVAFATDWRDDAARRDFTINALYADPHNREIRDYFGGLDDLAAGRIRFIGDAAARIEEDHLRILRFFRFHARFGKGEPDEQALASVVAKAETMRALSRERIASELLRLLVVDDPRATLELMVGHGIFAPIVPEIDVASLTRLDMLMANERASVCVADNVLRLIALAPLDPDEAAAMVAGLKLSTACRRRARLARAAAAELSSDPRHLAYRIGREAARDGWLLSGDPLGASRALARLEGWQPPHLPLKGGMIVARGVVAGPLVARLLAEAERRWVAEDFPNQARAREILDQLLEESFQ
jgi:poly(A) polymerase